MLSAFLGFGSEHALRHIADELADGVFTTDVEGRITYWNAAAQRITGWAPAEALGTTCSILAGDVVNGCSCGAGPIRCGLAASGRNSRQCTTRAKDGRLLVIVKSAVPLRDASGTHVGALESFTLVRDEARQRPAADGGLAGLVGLHPAMLELYRTIRLVASTSATVMICGESGSGKDRVAEAIHALGPRAAGPFVRVCCASFAAAFGGGTEASPLDRARGGTLLLDELGDLAPSAQLELLRRVEQLESARAGGPGDVGGDVRLLCTTHADLRRAVDEGRFRADLFFRLNVFPVRVPALREHAGDVVAIAEHVLRGRASPASLAAETKPVLARYGWPGNVRELENALAYAALRSEGDEIRPEHLPPEVSARPASAPAADEKAQLAEALGISRVTLWKRMKKHRVTGGEDG